ncbi:hemerythrin domain-containing protein [Phytohalomonas tamaricis]|uniref:hemerythrin domain-containing protein n=1 Tax=Phytohalomonas tamaricis TaxID=2081032 RepID=UPI0021D3FA01|nr:hemerythrin domain-containing protein [Phytohalomonas tamaricis]
MPMDAIELLKDDHVKLLDLLDQLSKTTERAKKTRPELLEKIALELHAHTFLEEEIFYPAFKDSNGKENDKMYFEAKEEHRAVEDLIIPDLKKTDPASLQFSGRAKVLKELLEHHIEEEEEEMFVQARDTMSSEVLSELGVQMAAKKKELMKQGQYKA